MNDPGGSIYFSGSKERAAQELDLDGSFYS